MSLFKKIGKALRPLGGVLKAGVSLLPGGQAILAARDVVRRARTETKSVGLLEPQFPSVRERVNLERRPSASLVARGYVAQRRVPVESYRNMLSSDARQRAAQPLYMSQPDLMAAGFTGDRTMSLLPSIFGGAGRAAGAIGRSRPGVGTGMAIGAAAERAMARGGGGRRRMKGITGAQLKAFTRVTAILNKYCKTPPPRRRASTRGKSCR
jgi:hypothetical protein